MKLRIELYEVDREGKTRWRIERKRWHGWESVSEVMDRDKAEQAVAEIVKIEEFNEAVKKVAKEARAEG